MIVVGTQQRIKRALLAAEIDKTISDYAGGASYGAIAGPSVVILTRRGRLGWRPCCTPADRFMSPIGFTWTHAPTRQTASPFDHVVS